MEVRPACQRGRDPGDRRGQGRQVLRRGDPAAGARHHAGASQKVGFLTWLNTGGKDFHPTKAPAFAARIDDPATFTPPEWDRRAGDGDADAGEQAPATLPSEPDRQRPRNLVYTMRFELPQPVKTFSITTYDPEDYMRVEVDKASLPAGCTLDKHPTYKSEFVPGHPVFADRVTCRLP